MNVLVIGCGNIGAQYDLHSDDIYTHAKAWKLVPNVNLTVFDRSVELANQISEFYACGVLSKIDDTPLGSFDAISICTPTDTHVKYLERSIKEGVKLIICEKPISLVDAELDALLEMQASQNKVIVNYFRRFLPEFLKLKDYIKSILDDGDKVININITYQRGFINNCSHAFDLLEFLLTKQLNLYDFSIEKKVYDHFSDDPTISFQSQWDDINLSVVGLTDAAFSYFEIEIFLKKHRIYIRNAGNNIDFYKSQTNERFLKPLQHLSDISSTGCMSNYMKYVIEEAILINSDKFREDNFKSSIELNRKMLNFLNK